MAGTDSLRWYDPRRILGLPGVYSLHSHIFGPADKKRSFVEQILEVKAGDRVLDIGCGPADFLEYFPDSEYYGFDADPDYIARARRKFGDRGVFETAYVSRSIVGDLESFDLAIANGVLHHLDDETALELFETAKLGLKPDGRLVTCDGTFVQGQNAVAKALIKMDRGQYIRNPEAYYRLATQVFERVEMSVHTDLSRLPYTHCVLRCFNG